jgi:hypothetical protein
VISAEPIVAMLKQAELGVAVADVICKVRSAIRPRQCATKGASRMAEFLFLSTAIARRKLTARRPEAKTSPLREKKQ